jgi:TatA/E family protein of Tat protein translocase
MKMGLFDQPWHIIILLLVVLLLFGSSRLPGAAKALGESMNIFKKSMKHDDKLPDADTPGFTQATVLTQSQSVPPAPQIPASQPSVAHQAQIDELQRQVADLQRSGAGNGSAPVSDSTASSSSN